LDDYREHLTKKTTSAWWPDIFADYWAAFSWRLHINQDPPPKDNPEPESAGEAVDGGVSTADGDPDADLTTEEKAQNAKVLTETEGVSFTQNTLIRHTYLESLED
jgi:hypothetical protein